MDSDSDMPEMIPMKQAKEDLKHQVIKTRKIKKPVEKKKKVLSGHIKKLVQETIDLKDIQP